MKNHRLFKVRYMPPTNTKGSRIQIKEDRGQKTESKIISFDYKEDSVKQQGINYLSSIGINVTGFGEVKDYYILFSDSWASFNEKTKKSEYIKVNGEVEKT